MLVYSPAGALLAEWGSPAGTPGSGSGEFNDPRGIAFDSRGDAYVADYGNNRIEEFSETGAFLGQWGATGGRAAQFQGPSGLAVGGDGDVYVTDEGNDRVEVFDPHGQFLEQWGSPGGELGQFAQPAAIAIGCEGAVFVADSNNNRVERFQSAAVPPADCVQASSRTALPPPPAVAPTVRVSFDQTTSVLPRRTLPIDVSCRQACRVIVAATLSTRRPVSDVEAQGGTLSQRDARSERAARPRSRRMVTLADIARRLPAGQTVRVGLHVPDWAARHLRRALRRGALVTARVAIVATAPTGQQTTVFRTYRVMR